MKKIGLMFLLAGVFQFGNSQTYTSMEEALKNPDKVENLDLSEQGLSEFPSDIRKFKNLDYLNISKNKIKSIPAWIGELKKLETLYFQENQIEKLPDEICELELVYELWINNNKLTSLPTNIGELNGLTNFWFYDNQISKLPESFGKLVKLENIEAKNNQICSLPASIWNLRAFKWDFANNKIKALPQMPVDPEYPEDPFYGNTRELILTNNPIKTIKQSFLGFNKLEKVILKGTKIGQNQLEKLKALFNEDVTISF